MNIESNDYQGRTCRLVNVKSGEPIKMGETIVLRNDAYRVTGGRAPHTPASTGKVWVVLQGTNMANGATAEYYPGVIDAQWMPLEGGK